MLMISVAEQYLAIRIKCEDNSNRIVQRDALKAVIGKFEPDF